MMKALDSLAVRIYNSLGAMSAKLEQLNRSNGSIADACDKNFAKTRELIQYTERFKTQEKKTYAYSMVH